MTETKKKKTAPQQKKRPSSEPVMEGEEDYCKAISPTHTNPKEQHHSPSTELRPSVFKEALDVRQGKRKRDEEGLNRPPEAGFRLSQQERRSGHEWVDDYAPSYGHTPAGPQRSQYTRQWSPVSYGGEEIMMDAQENMSTVVVCTAPARPSMTTEKRTMIVGGGSLIDEAEIMKTVNAMTTAGSPCVHNIRGTYLDDIYWDALVAIRKTEEVQLKSAKMASIAKGRGSKNTTRKALEHSIVLKLAQDLKRDPYPTEVQEVLEKEWALVQEAARERKRLRTLTNASNAATEATKVVEKRLEVLEAFALKWEPEFLNWKTQNRTLLQLPLSTMFDENTAAENELALVAADADFQPMNDVQEEAAGQTSDDEDCTGNKSSAEEESHSGNDNSASDSDNIDVENSHPLTIVELDEEELPITCRAERSVPEGPTTKKTALASKIVAIAPKATMPVGTTSMTDSRPMTVATNGKGKQPLKVVKSAPVAIVSKVVPKKAVAQVSGSAGSAEVEEKHAVTATGTRKKAELNSIDTLVLLDEDGTPEKSMRNEVPRKKTTTGKKNGKPPQPKGDSKGEKRQK